MVGAEIAVDGRSTVDEYCEKLEEVLFSSLFVWVDVNTTRTLVYSFSFAVDEEAVKVIDDAIVSWTPSSTVVLVSEAT